MHVNVLAHNAVAKLPVAVRGTVRRVGHTAEHPLMIVYSFFDAIEQHTLLPYLSWALVLVGIVSMIYSSKGE